MTNISNTKEIFHFATHWISKGMKNAVFISIAPGAEILISNESVSGTQQKNRLKISYLWNEPSKTHGYLKIERSLRRV